MSHRQLHFKIIKATIYFLMMVGCYSLVFIFADNDFIACSSLILSIVFMVLFILSFRVNPKPNFKLIQSKKKTIMDNPLNLNQIKEIYKFKNLNDMNGKVEKIFFHKTGEKRCVLYKESNSIKTCFEILNYFEDSTKLWTLDFAQWNLVESGRSLYIDVETALSENKVELKDYKEEAFEDKLLHEIGVEIVWKGITLESKLIPFGSYNEFDIKMKNKIINNVIIHNTEWYSFNNSKAVLCLKKDQILEEKSFRFQILHQGKVIGKGKHYKYQNSRFL